MVLTGMVVLTGFLLVVTKFLDCYTTVLGFKRKGNYLSNERNPIARFIMRYLGIKITIWGVWVLTIALAGWIGYECIIKNDLMYSAGYIITGLIISAAQFEVARRNYLYIRN